MSVEDISDFVRQPHPADDTWELYHENSKTGRFDHYPPDDIIRARMSELAETLDYDAYPEVMLPSPMRLDVPLGDAMADRATARALEPVPLDTRTIGSLLHYAYGQNRDNTGTPFPRPFRYVPSGGALYPLELYLHVAHAADIAPGIHHYDPTRHALRSLVVGDQSRQISGALVQQQIAFDASLIVFITAVFERSVFKYRERGYRFVLLEAGHVAQNLNLAAGALGLGIANIGGFFDRDVDALLAIDGLTHSALYLAAIGRRGDERGRTALG